MLNSLRKFSHFLTCFEPDWESFFFFSLAAEWLNISKWALCVRVKRAFFSRFLKNKLLDHELDWLSKEKEKNYSLEVAWAMNMLTHNQIQFFWSRTSTFSLLSSSLCVVLCCFLHTNSTCQNWLSIFLLLSILDSNSRTSPRARRNSMKNEKLVTTMLLLMLIT